MKRLPGVFLCLVFFSFPFSLYASTATQTMQATVDEVLTVLKDPSLKDQQFQGEKKKKIWEIVDSAFDYTLLSQQALGIHWRKMSTDQQKEFIKLYSKLLGRSYINKIMSYEDETILILKEKPLAEDIAEVQTTIVAQANTIPVFYRLAFEKGEWRVFDIIIEGVSLTKNYRSQFKKFLSKKSIDQLLKALRKKTGAKKNEAG